MWIKLLDKNQLLVELDRVACIFEARNRISFPPGTEKLTGWRPQELVSDEVPIRIMFLHGNDIFTVISKKEWEFLLKYVPTQIIYPAEKE